MIEILRGGIKGDKGTPGKSAYQLWLDEGNTGTEEDFLEWLKGAIGPPGQKGNTGTSSGVYQKWEPPLQANFRSDLPDMVFDAYGDYDPMRAYAQLWDPMIEAEPEWVTRTEIGRDATGEFPIYLYDFCPPVYDKKIIIVANVHGGERMSQYGAYFFFNHMINHWRERTDFSYCRNNVRWIVIPNGNPWGYKNNARLTPGGVNIERNADYLWDRYAVFPPPSENFKGSVVWSEPETRAIRDVVLEHQDAVAFIDMHFFGSLGTGGSYPVYSSGGGADSMEFVEDVVNALHKEGSLGFDNPAFLRAYYPSLYGWAKESLGMHAFLLEFDSGYFSPSYGPECNTAATRWYGNVMLRAAQLQSKVVKSRRDQPIAGICSYDRGLDGVTINITNTSYVDQEQFKVIIPNVTKGGVISVYGTVTALLGSPLQFWICPYLGQDYQGLVGPGDPRGDKGFWEVFDRNRLCEVMTTSVGETGVGRVTLPFFATFPVTPTKIQGGNGPGPLTLGIKMRVTSGNAQLISYRMNWVLTPSAAGDEKVEVYYCKNVGGVDSMIKVCPFY